MSESYRDLGGGSADPDVAPECDWHCDGTGYDRDSDRLAVACPVHRPHLVRTRTGSVQRRLRRTYAR